jgi:tetratricopeptide (TPR) repeat protein
MRQWSSKNKAIAITCAIIFLASLVYYLSYYKYLPLTGDEGHLVNGTMRVLDGQLPLKDFYQTYSPGRYWLLALLFRLFGASLSVERLLWVFVHAASSVLLYLVARRSMPPRFAAIPLLMMMVIPGIWNKTLCNLLALANILVICEYVERFDRRSLMLCGAAAGFTIWFRQDIGGYAALTVVACLVVRRVLSLKSLGGGLTTQVRTALTTLIKDLLILSTPIFLSLLPLVILYWLRSGLYELLYGMTIGRIRSVFVISSPFPSPLLIFVAQPTSPTRSEILFLYAVLIMFASLCLVLLIQAAKSYRKGVAEYNYVLFSTLFLTILLFRGHIYPFAHMYRLPQDGSLIYILGGYILFRTHTNVSSLVSGWTKSRRIGSAVGIACTLVLLALPAYYVGYTLVAESTMGGGIPLTGSPYAAIDSPHAGTSLPENQATDLNETIDYITAHTDPQDTIFAFNTPQLYFLSQRRNATRQDKINPSLAEAWAEEQLLEDLRENKAPLIVVTPSEARRFLISLHTIRNEIAQHYRPSTAIGTTYIFRRSATLSTRHSSLGLIYEIAGERDQAVSEYRKALTAHPDDEMARERLSQLLYRQGNILRAGGQIQAALAAYREAIAVEPSNAEIHEALGRLYREQNLLAEAAAEYETAIELDPSRASAFRGLGLTYEGLGRPEDAVAAYQEAAGLYESAVELDLADADTYEGLGSTYEHLGRIEEAASAYLQAVRLDPSSATARERLARIYREQGNLQGAAAEYEKAIALDPMRPNAYWGLGQTYERLGSFQDAIVAYGEVVRIDPSREQAQRVLEGLSSASVEDIRYPLWANLGDAISFLGYDVEAQSLRAGETVELTLWWKSISGMDRDYTVFVHVVGTDGRIWAQEDRLLVRGIRGTSEWTVGWIARECYELDLPPDAPSGSYVIKVGIYYWQTGERLSAWDGSNQSLPEDAIGLEPISVRQ